MNEMVKQKKMAQLGMTTLLEKNPEIKIPLPEIKGFAGICESWDELENFLENSFKIPGEFKGCVENPFLLTFQFKETEIKVYLHGNQLRLKIQWESLRDIKKLYKYDIQTGLLIEKVTCFYEQITPHHRKKIKLSEIYEYSQDGFLQTKLLSQLLLNNENLVINKTRKAVYKERVFGFYTYHYDSNTGEFLGGKYTASPKK